jgi:hypothetical protein
VRRIAEAKLAADCGVGGDITLEDDSNVSFPIKSIHRAVAKSKCFSNALKVPCRSCYSCAKCKVGGVLNCKNGAADKSNNKPWLDGETPMELEAVLIEAKSQERVACQCTSGPVIDAEKAVFESHEPDHALAIEPQAEADPRAANRPMELPV